MNNLEMKTADYSESDLLKFIEQNDIVNLANVRVLMEKMKNQEYLDMHPYEIFESSGSWWTYFPDKIKGRVAKKRKKKEDLENLIIEYYKQEVENPTIEELFREWNNRIVEKGEVKQSTADRNVDYFKRHFKEMGKYRVKNITIKEWAEFLENEVATKKLNKTAYQGLKNIVFGILKRAKIKGIISYRIDEILEYTEFGKNSFRKKKKNDEQEVFNEEETEIVLEYLVKNLDKHNLAILLMFLTGLRVGEIAALENKNIKDNYLIITNSETRNKKKNQKGNDYELDLAKTENSERIVAIPEGCEWVCRELKKLNPDGDFVFVNKKGRMTTNCFRRRLEQVCKKLSIVQKSPHKIRKTYASILLDENCDNCIITQQMGHTDISVTEDAYHRNRKTIDKKSKRLGEIKEFRKLKNVM